MAGLLGEDYEDPATQGLLSAGLSMLAASGPSTKRTSVGQVLGLGGLQGMQAYQAAHKQKLLDEEARRRNELAKAQIEELLAQAQRNKALAAKGIDPQDPSSIREWKEFEKMTPEQQARYLEMKRQMYQVTDVNGVPTLVGRSPGIAQTPLTTLEQEASGQATIAGAKQRSIEHQKAIYDLLPTTGPSGGPEFNTRLRVLGGLNAGVGQQPQGSSIPPSDTANLPPAIRTALEGVQVPPQGGGAAPRPIQAASGSTKADEQFATDAVSYVTGGYQDVMTQIAGLRGVKKELGSTDTATGPMIGLIPDKLLAFGNQKAVDLKDRVAGIVQRSLRPILGAQFTEKEGENLINRAYNPSLDEKYNISRLGRLVKQMEKAAEAKKSAAEYFMQHKTLAGWEGKLPTLSDFQDAIDNESLDNQPDVGEIRYTKDGRKARWDGNGWRLQ